MPDRQGETAATATAQEHSAASRAAPAVGARERVSGRNWGQSGVSQPRSLRLRAALLQCEFLNANVTGHGYGACRSSKGDIYRLIR